MRCPYGELFGQDHGFMEYIPATWNESGFYRCLKCGERSFVEMEETKNLGPCHICGKPRTRGHHHAKGAEVLKQLPTPSQVVTTATSVDLNHILTVLRSKALKLNHAIEILEEIGVKGA